MKLFSRIAFACIYVFLYSFKCNCFEPVSTSVIVTGGLVLSASFMGVNYLKGAFNEYCDKRWIIFNDTAFDEAVEERLFGQHLAKFVISRSLKGHFRRRTTQKPLVMSFHGWTGSGKNFVANMIVDNLYKLGSHSKFVHWYIANQHFPHQEYVKEYKDNLSRTIKEETEKCDHSIFIFDEVDKMPAGVIDALKPYIDYHEHIDGIDYRNNIFIFLSNAGGNDITKITFNYWLDGKDRELITMKDIEPLINEGAFNERGGFYKSEIVAANLIDIYVPFLPLEKKHVKNCIRADIKARNEFAAEEKIDEIANQLNYHPTEFEIFSTSGCKRISQKIDIYI